MPYLPVLDCRPPLPRSVTDSSDSQAGCSLQTTRFLLRVPPRSHAFSRVFLSPLGQKEISKQLIISN